MVQDTSFIKKRAPTLYAIIIIKVAKGLILLFLALGVYHLSDRNLPDIFDNMLRFFHLDPENKFFASLANRVEGISEAKMVWLAGGTLFYSLFSLVEGIGLIFRVSWAGWLAIGESAFFVPIEVYELVEKKPFSRTVFVILAINVLIVFYLFRNRQRLFRHHHH